MYFQTILSIAAGFYFTSCCNIYSQKLNLEFIRKIQIDETGYLWKKEPTEITMLDSGTIGMFAGGNLLNTYSLVTGKLVNSLYFENSLDFQTINISDNFRNKINAHDGTVADRIAFSKKYRDPLLSISTQTYRGQGQPILSSVFCPFIYNIYDGTDTTTVTVLGRKGYVLQSMDGLPQLIPIEHNDTHSFSSGFFFRDTLYLNQYSNKPIPPKLAIFYFNGLEKKYVNSGELIINTRENRIDYLKHNQNINKDNSMNKMVLKVQQGHLFQNKFREIIEYDQNRYLYNNENIFDLNTAHPLLSVGQVLDTTAGEQIKNINLINQHFLILTYKKQPKASITDKPEYTIHKCTMSGKKVQSVPLKEMGRIIKVHLKGNRLCLLLKTEEFYELAIYHINI